MHAYLIIAHTNYHQLQQLVTLLDDERNDIYIHIDKKSDTTNLHLRTSYSNLYFAEKEDVRWGGVSQLNAEYRLFELASQLNYSYYHLISGFDLPLHNQDYIHSFFDQHQGTEFIGFGRKNWDIKNRVYCRNLCGRQMRYPNKLIRYAFKAIRLLGNKFQNATSIYLTDNKKQDLDYRYGCQWVSVTHDFVLALIAEKQKLLSMYRYSYCPDEIYKQTFAWNSHFRERLFDADNEFHGCMREIDWNRGCPYVYRIDDYNLLSNSKKLFARKFDERVDAEIIAQIINKINNESNQ